MLCPNCTKQIPDDAHDCIFCGHKIDIAKQLPHEIKQRRYQRWGIYAVIIILVLGMIGFMVYIYDQNNKNTQKIIKTKDELNKVQANLNQTQANLEEKKQELQSALSQVTTNENLIEQKNQELMQKTQEYKDNVAELQNQLETARQTASTSIVVATTTDECLQNEQQLEICSLQLNETSASMLYLLQEIGRGISNNDLFKIPVARDGFFSEDSDNDGLPDLIEDSFGLDKNNKDTDGDGFSDGAEVYDGYNPHGEGMASIDEIFTRKLSGMLLLQVEQNGEAWYVNPDDHKRYFLGRPSDSIEVIRNLGKIK